MAKEEKAIGTQSNLKDFSYLKREFLTTTLVINLQQANQKQWKISTQERIRFKCVSGSGSGLQYSQD